MTDEETNRLLGLCERAKRGDIRQLFYHPTDSLLISRAIEVLPALVAEVRRLRAMVEVNAAPPEGEEESW